MSSSHHSPPCVSDADTTQTQTAKTQIHSISSQDDDHSENSSPTTQTAHTNYLDPDVFDLGSNILSQEFQERLTLDHLAESDDGSSSATATVQCNRKHWRPHIKSDHKSQLHPVSGTTTHHTNSSIEEAKSESQLELALDQFELQSECDSHSQPDPTASATDASTDVQTHESKSSSELNLSTDWDSTLLTEALETLQDGELLNDNCVMLCFDMLFEEHKATDAGYTFLIPQLLTELKLRPRGAQAGLWLLEQLMLNKCLQDNVRHVLLPVCDNLHWCLVDIDLVTGRLLHYDSLKDSCSSAAYIIRCLRIGLKKWKPFPSDCEPEPEAPPCKWPRENMDVPRQDNEIDCGVFMLHFVQQLLKRDDFVVTQESIPQERQSLRHRLIERGPQPVFAKYMCS
jgi:Ulp1 family protease